MKHLSLCFFSRGKYLEQDFVLGLSIFKWFFVAIFKAKYIVFISIFGVWDSLKHQNVKKGTCGTNATLKFHLHPIEYGMTKVDVNHSRIILQNYQNYIHFSLFPLLNIPFCFSSRRKNIRLVRNNLKVSKLWQNVCFKMERPLKWDIKCHFVLSSWVAVWVFLASLKVLHINIWGVGYFKAPEHKVNGGTNAALKSHLLPRKYGVGSIGINHDGIISQNYRSGVFIKVSLYQYLGFCVLETREHTKSFLEQMQLSNLIYVQINMACQRLTSIVMGLFHKITGREFFKVH